MRNKKEKKNVVLTTSKKLKLSKESKRFLDCMEYVFGVISSRIHQGTDAWSFQRQAT